MNSEQVLDTLLDTLIEAFKEKKSKDKIVFSLFQLKKFIALVEAAEREACAAVCERLPETFKIAADEFGYKAEMPTAENYAAAIRARSEV